MVNWVNSQIVPPLDIGVLTPEVRIPVPVRGTSIGTPAAAYSLRNLSTTYTGNVVDVRRSSDDAEDSFTAAEVADGTLTDWVNEIGVIRNRTASAKWTTVTPTATGFDAATTNVGACGYDLYGSSGDSVTVTFDVLLNSGSFSVQLRDGFESGSSVSNSEIISTSGSKSFTLTSSADFVALQFISASADIEVTNFSINTPWTNDGFVTKWYDQSGNDNHATQGTDASQPKIVNGGSLVTNNGNAVVNFQSIDDRHFIFGAGIDLTARTVFYAGRPASTNFQNLLGNTSNSSTNYIRTLNNVAGRPWETEPSSSIFVDGSAYAGGDVSDQGYSLNTFVFDSDATVNFLGGTGAAISDTPIVDASEIIIYPSDQSANRTAIEANIGETYGITGIPAYDNTVDGFVETWYDQSGNDNHATQGTDAKHPKIVAGGVLVRGNTGEPAFTGDGVDDILSLSSSINFGTGEFFVSTVVDVDTGGVVIGSASPNWMLLVTTSSIQVRASNTNVIYIISPDSVLTAGESYLISLSRVGNDITAYVNGVAQADVETVVSTDTFSADRFLQRGTNGNPYPDPVSEVIIYASDQSANRVGIETNINDHYNIY